MSAYTRAVNTRAHGSAGRMCARVYVNARARMYARRTSALVYRNARGQTNPPTCVEDATCTRWIVYVASDR